MTREQLDAIRERMENGFLPTWPDARALLAEVERLTTLLAGTESALDNDREYQERLKAEVADMERAAFKRGVAAMREAAAKECWNASDELADIPDMETEQGTLQNVAYRIRAIPDPEDTP